MDRSRNKDARSGNRTQDLFHQGCALTDCAILVPCFLDNLLYMMLVLLTKLLLTLARDQCVDSAKHIRPWSVPKKKTLLLSYRIKAFDLWRHKVHCHV